MQVFAVPLDYCKAPKPMPYKQQAAGEDAPPLVFVLLPECLLAGRRAFRSRDTSGLGPFVFRDGPLPGRPTGEVVVRHRRVPPTAGGVDPDEVVAGRGAPADLTRDGRTGHATHLAEIGRAHV